MTASSPSPLAVAVVSFNTRELLEACLASVQRAGAAEIIVVDNGSTDGSVELIRERFPEIRLIVQEENRGYGRAADAAIADASRPYVLLLNSDTLLAPGAADALALDLDEHPRAAVVGPRLANADGSLQRSAYPFPSAWDTFLGETGLHLAVRRIPGLRELFLRTWSHNRPRRVPWVLGAALAIRRSAFLEIGGFDERFFMYGEDVDLCRRFADAGWEVRYSPVTTIVHLGGGSTRRHEQAMRREFLASKRAYLLRHDSRRAGRVLAVFRVVIRARTVRDRIRLLFARDADERHRLEALIAGQRALLAEHELWRT
jgi:GT2 family glycosyltransferase